MIWLALFFLGTTTAACCWAIAVQRGLDFAYCYALERSTINDPAGCAYSDMATVIVLCTERDGRRLAQVGPPEGPSINA